MTNIFLDKKWQSSHLKKAKKRAGSRYTPELNIDLPIAQIFDGISRTEDFYTSIRKSFRELSREFNYVSSKYNNKKAQRRYQSLKDKIILLSKLLSKIKKYDTKAIPWAEIKCLVKKSEFLVWKLSDLLREEKAQLEKVPADQTDEGQKNRREASERISFDIHHLYKVQRKLRYFEGLSLSTKAKLSNNPLLLLTGAAGTGKTHLLCDVAESRTKKFLPVVLVFGELFSIDEKPFTQIIRQLGLKLNKNQFLRLFNNAGRQLNCRALLIIDALNETKGRNFWKRNLNQIIRDVKKYPNIALVVSVRSGFEEEILTKKQKNIFVNEEHRGFQFREWEAVSKFFKEFNLPLPEIPLLTPEFQHPLFLLLFCKAFQDRAKKKKKKPKKKKQIFRGHEGATYIFEAFIDNVSKRISKQFGISNAKNKNVWDAVIEKIAEIMVDQNSNKVSETQVLTIIKNAYPLIDHQHFIKELDRSLLLVKVPKYSIEKRAWEGFEFRFPFQKFSDHLIGRYFFKKYEKEFGKQNKNLGTARKFFSRRRKLGKFLSKSWSRGFIEALSIQCPEHLNGYELIDVAPYLRNSRLAQEAFVESLVWRKPEAFSTDLKNTLAYVNSKIIRTEDGHQNLLNAFLTVAPIPNHPFNADFLHKHLFKFSMAERDSWWSTFLHYQYEQKGAVDRLIKWGWSEQDRSYISDEAIRLCSVALTWFLTTPNRFLRDKSTKALVAVLVERLDIVLSLLKQFNSVNDPYIRERLYAVAYGCALRSKDNKSELKALAKWVYENIFQNGNPPVHILLRDYARGIIEVALQNKLKLRINLKRVNPPYKSQFPKRLPSSNAIKKYEFDYKDKDFKEYFWAQNSIIHSMQPEHSEIFMYGDFGRYTFQSALSHFNYPKNITMQALSNWATKRVFDLGYNVQLHGKFDRNLDYYHNSGRSEHKAERIGKKYQWIAFHELLARVSDNFEFKEDFWSQRTEKYSGVWQLSGIRDIDPSCTLHEFPNERKDYIPTFKSFKPNYSDWIKSVSYTDWLKTKRKLPNPKSLIELTGDKGIKWIVLEGTFDWQEETPPEIDKYQKPTRTLWYMIKSYLVKEKDRKEILIWAKKQRFYGRWMPESHEFYNVFLAEYPSAPAFLHHYIPYYYHDGWTDRGDNSKIPAKILVTDDQYLSSGSSIDCSVSEAIKVKLPAKWIMDKMGLVHSYIDGCFFDKSGQLATFDPTVFNTEAANCILIRKDKLCHFLKKEKCSIFWTLLGEKQTIGGGGIGQPYGWQEISGVYSLNENNKLIGSMGAEFKNPTPQ